MAFPWTYISVRVASGWVKLNPYICCPSAVRKVWACSPRKSAPSDQQRALLLSLDLLGGVVGCLAVLECLRGGLVGEELWMVNFNPKTLLPDRGSTT